jgi:CheY-like chemotaxis protein
MPECLLIVDDEQDFCLSLSDVLGEFGYVTDVAYRAREALELAKGSKHRLALLDFKLPCMTGVELFNQLRAIDGGIEAMLVTGFASSETTEAAAAAGIRQVVEKPVDVPKLLSLINEALA